MFESRKMEKEKFMIEIRISRCRLFEVEEKIAAHPNVFVVYDMTGKKYPFCRGDRGQACP